MNDKTATGATGEDAPPVITESFADMLEESLGETPRFEGSVVKGRVLAIQNDMVLIDVGLKVEGWVSLKEFGASPPEVDGNVEVFVERVENRRGEAVLSREKARREEAWTMLEQAFENSERVTGVIFGRVKGGFTVDINGAFAFLPGSQVDIRPVRDITPLLNTEQPFQILKMDRRRGNIVVSRRAVLEDSRAEQRGELIASLREGQVLEGVVKNITDYGAFVDLGGIDGLLHVTDIAWRRINHPTEALSIGQTINVQVIRFNSETQRISLGLKQLETDPWDGVESKYPVGTVFKGRVTNIADYGAFVELEPGVEGLVHVSEMSWTKKNVYPGKIVSTSQEVEVMVLDVDPQKRRISLGLKQCMPNPWDSFADQHPVDSEIEGEVKNITEFGLFVELPGEIFGMAHLSDLDWNRSGEQALADYTVGDKVKAKILNIEVEKERISLGVKQLTDDPFAGAVGELKKGATVTCTVTGVQDSGVEVEVAGGTAGFVRKSDLARDRSEHRPDRFAKGDKVDAKVTNIDRQSRKITLSIKALEVEEEKQAMAEYGSADSGASLGEILGAAINKKAEETDGAEPAAEVDGETTSGAPAEPEPAETTVESESATVEEPPAEAEATPEVDVAAPLEVETKAKPKPKAKPKTKVKPNKPKPKADGEKKTTAKKATKTASKSTKTTKKAKTAKDESGAGKDAAKADEAETS